MKVRRSRPKKQNGSQKISIWTSAWTRNADAILGCTNFICKISQYGPLEVSAYSKLKILINIFLKIIPKYSSKLSQNIPQNSFAISDNLSTYDFFQNFVKFISKLLKYTKILRLQLENGNEIWKKNLKASMIFWPFNKFSNSKNGGDLGSMGVQMRGKFSAKLYNVPLKF